MHELTGQSEAFTVIGTVTASEDDLSLIAGFIGQQVDPDDIAVVEAVAFDDSKNANGWQVANLDGIEVLGASLNYDHANEVSKSFGTIFAARTEGNRKIVKAVIPKTGKNADVLTDIRYKVAKYTSPKIRVAEWADEKKQIVKAGRLVHLSFVDDPAYGTDNKVLSLAASAEQDETQRFADLGRAVHADNITAAVRYAERRAGGFTSAQRDEARSKYAAMAPTVLHGEVLPMLKELSTRTGATSQRTVSAITDDSSIKSVRRPNLFPSQATNLFGEGKNNGI